MNTLKTTSKSIVGKQILSIDQIYSSDSEKLMPAKTGQEQQSPDKQIIGQNGNKLNEIENKESIEEKPDEEKVEQIIMIIK